MIPCTLRKKKSERKVKNIFKKKLKKQIVSGTKAKNKK